MGEETDPGSSRSRIVVVLGLACLLLAVACVCLAVTVGLLSVSSSPCRSPDEAVMNDEETPPTHAGAEKEVAAQSGRWESSYRLPSSVEPLSYELTLRPDIPEGTFEGQVAILVHVSSDSPYVAVHIKNLDILESRVLRVQQAAGEGYIDGDEAPLEGAFAYKPHELWVLQLQTGSFTPGFYRLRFSFQGRLVGKIVGFYRSEYWDEDAGIRRSIATTKFQPTYARQAYPCFDEPGFKSRFKVHIIHASEDGYTALSNMNVEKIVADDPSSGLTTVYFNESVPMVTYLTCFIVSNFKKLPSANLKPQNIPFSVYSTPYQVAKTEFARDVGAAIAEYYIKYFDIEYPLPKLDMIAIPDFVSGAMENWGIVTFRETNLLYDPVISSVGNKQRVTTVVAHELAHMWFGNLMTLKWWDDLWLNEGFASYMQYCGVNNSFPEWKMMDQFLVDTLYHVFVLDSALSSHPIVQPVHHPDEISELFDTISYSKGAAIIRMLENIMGNENFRRGISKFLKKYEYKNAVTQDLWDILQSVVEENLKGREPVNITHIMGTWTLQMGFPVVNVKLDSEGNRLLTQQRFLADPNSSFQADDSPFRYKWDIPITYITSEGSDVKRTWLLSEQEKLIIPKNEKSEWLKINHQHIGYYRVNYPESDWIKFSELLQDNITVFDTSNRASLLEDSFSLADAGLLKYDVAMKITQYLAQENEYVPWAVAANKFSKLQNFLLETPVYSNFRTYVKNLLKNVYNKVSWTVSESDSHLTRELRMVILNLSCKMGLEECLEQAGSEFTKWLQNPSEHPHPDIRTLVYQYGMERSGTEKYWDIMWDLYLNETDAQEKVRLIQGLASIREPWLLKRFIQLAKIETNIRSQDFVSTLMSITGNPVGNPIVWDFVRSEWKYLVDRFSLNDRYLGRLIPVICGHFSTQFKLQEMQVFFTQYPDAGAGKSARAQALETAQTNIQWISKHAKTLEEWLTKNTEKI